MNQPIAKVKQGIDAVRRFLDPPLAPDAPPIEIRASVVDAIERHVAVAGIGKRAFPYDAVSVHILLTHPEDRIPLELVFEDLEARIRQRLRELRCDVPSGLTARVTLIEQPERGWTPGQRFAIDCARAEPLPRQPDRRRPSLAVTIVKGTASRTAYSFRSAVILIGRSAAAVDTRGRVRRRNHIAFDERSTTVSRAHARIVYDRERDEYRLLDEGSVRGTRVVRGDMTFDVRPRHEDSRGVRLQSGDEIHTGDTAVRIVIG
ncbi:MAG TPA: FHA domain-containing protein [Vicinamibacterales bacterium]